MALCLVGRGSLVDDTYQISWPYALSIQTRGYVNPTEWLFLDTVPLDIVVSEKKILKVFIFENLFLSDVTYIRIILALFGQNPASCLGGDIL